MDPVTITCDICGQTAVIHKVRYTYADVGAAAPIGQKLVVQKVERDVECPGCGMRTQVERFEE